MTRPEGTKGNAVITRDDVERAQAVIDVWLQEHAYPIIDGTGEQALKAVQYMRGLITQALADAHARGHDEGVARGRWQVGHTILDALDSEGLLTTSTRAGDPL